jgi:hypothetical protein
VDTALAALIPGYGLLAQKRAFSPVLLLTASWLIARGWSGTVLPFALDPRLTLPGQEVPLVALATASVLVYAVSLLGYLRLVQRERAREAALHTTQRGRVQQSTRRAYPTAA